MKKIHKVQLLKSINMIMMLSEIDEVFHVMKINAEGDIYLDMKYDFLEDAEYYFNRETSLDS